VRSYTLPWRMTLEGLDRVRQRSGGSRQRGAVCFLSNSGPARVPETYQRLSYDNNSFVRGVKSRLYQGMASEQAEIVDHETKIPGMSAQAKKTAVSTRQKHLCHMLGNFVGWDGPGRRHFGEF